MSTAVNTSNNTRKTETADPQPAPTPEELVAQLRAMRNSIPDVAPLTPEQKRSLRNRLYLPDEVVRAQINVLGASQYVESAIGQAPDAVRVMAADSIRWDVVEDEAKALLAGIEGANLTRRERVAFVAGQAYRVGVSLAKDPAHAELVPHVQEVRRLKRNTRRTKPSSGDPAPQTPPANPHPQAGM